LKFSGGLKLYLENEGMAWGLKSRSYGKLFLTVLDWLQLWNWILLDCRKKTQSNYLIVAIALIWQSLLET
jgi:lipoprotein signal peptidase